MLFTDHQYKLVALGGTFDLLHEGHIQLLSEAFKIGATVLIGVTSDAMVKSLGKNHTVLPYARRVNNIRKFLKARGWSTRARVSKLNEPYGPAARRKKLQTLIVSKNTFQSGRRLNELRRKAGLNPLNLHVVRLRVAGDGKPISTTRIRNGEIDLRGRLLKCRD